jgi:hypothetical protein
MRLLEDRWLPLCGYFLFLGFLEFGGGFDNWQAEAERGALALHGLEID